MIPVFETALCSLDWVGEQEVGWGPSRSSRIQLLFVFRAPTTLKVFPRPGSSLSAPGARAVALPCARGHEAGFAGLRSPHSLSCSGCGSWEWGSGRDFECGCGSGCGCCSFRGCGRGCGCDWGSGLSSRCSGSWRRTRGWVGSRGWDASGHCREGKANYRPFGALSSASPGPSLRP